MCSLHYRFLILITFVMALAVGCHTFGKRGRDGNPVPSLWPVRSSEHVINSGFGDKRVHPGKSPHTHAGVDIKAALGTDVLATAAGIVQETGYDQGGYGKYIRIQHNRVYETLYAHLSQILVRRGQFVRRGATIGKVGKTGNATGPHLHYEVRKNGIPVDPLPYLPYTPKEKR